MKRLKKLGTALLLISLCLPLMSYITVPSSTHYAEDGDELNLWVPDVPRGYVDKALWACASPYIKFKEKDETWAVVEVLPGFSGSTIVELYYTEKYLTTDGKTRANTYRKEFIIVSKGASSSSPTRIVVPEIIEVHMGESIDVPITFEPEGTTAKVTCSTPSPSGIISANVYMFTTLRIYGGKEGTASLTLASDNNLSTKCTVKVLPPTFPDIDPGNGETNNDRNLKEAVERIENLNGEFLKFKTGQ